MQEEKLKPTPDSPGNNSFLPSPAINVAGTSINQAHRKVLWKLKKEHANICFWQLKFCP